MVFINQFYNMINYLAHYNETGQEIYNELNGKIDWLYHQREQEKQ